DVLCSVRLAKAYGQHLAEAALDGPAEARVRLDPADHDDAGRPRRVGVDVHRHASLGRAKDDRFHRRPDRHAKARLVDPVAGEHFALPLGRPTAVTAHRRHDERRGAQRSQLVDDRRDDLEDWRDASAADRDRHLGARRQPQVERTDTGADRRRQVGDCVVREVLANRNQARTGHTVVLGWILPFRTRRGASGGAPTTTGGGQSARAGLLVAALSGTTRPGCYGYRFFSATTVRNSRAISFRHSSLYCSRSARRTLSCSASMIWLMDSARSFRLPISFRFSSIKMNVGTER